MSFMETRMVFVIPSDKLDNVNDFGSRVMWKVNKLYETIKSKIDGVIFAIAQKTYGEYK